MPVKDNSVPHAAIAVTVMPTGTEARWLITSAAKAQSKSRLILDAAPSWVHVVLKVNLVRPMVGAFS